MNRRPTQGVPKGGYGSLACAPIRRRSRSKSRSPRSSPSSNSERSKSRSTRSSRERARRRRRRRGRRSRSESSSSSDSSSSSSGSRGSSRRRGSNHSGSRPPPRVMPMASPHFGKHGSGNGMGVIGMGTGSVTMGGISGVSMVIGGGVGVNVGVSKDYASMASVAAVPSARDLYALRSHAGGGRGYVSSASLHPNGSLGRVVPSAGGGKDYASLADASAAGSRLGGGSGGDRRSGGSYADQARDVRHAGRMLGAAISSGGGGRFDRGGKAPPSPPGRDQFGRERDWRGNAPNGRRVAVSVPASNGQPSVVHGSGFGTFSMASSMSMAGNSGVSLSSATTSNPKAFPARDSRSPVRVGAQAPASSLSSPLTRADFVRQHSRREQRQRQHERRLSTSSSSSSSSSPSSSSEDGRHRQPNERMKRKHGSVDRQQRSSSEHRDRNIYLRDHHQWQLQQQHLQGSTAEGEGKRRDRRDMVGAAAAPTLVSNRTFRDRSSSPCAGAGADGDRKESGAPPFDQNDFSLTSSRQEKVGSTGGGGVMGGGYGAGTFAGLAPRVELPKSGDDPGGGNGMGNGGFHAQREGDRNRAYPRQGVGQGQGRYSRGSVSSINEDAEASCGEADDSHDEGEVSSGGRGMGFGGRERQQDEDARVWKRDAYWGGDFRRSSGIDNREGGDRAGGTGGGYRGNGNEGGTPGARGFIRERDRPDSPRDRSRYNPTPPQPPPMAGTDEQQGGHHDTRGDRQDKRLDDAGVTGGHKRPRSPESVGMDLDGDSPSPPPSRHQDPRSQDSRGTGGNYSELCSNRSVNHVPKSNRHGRSSPPADSRHAAERTHNPWPKPPPLQDTAPNGPGGRPQHYQSRHSYRHNPNQSSDAGGATGPRPGRSSSHNVALADRNGSRLGPSVRPSLAPMAGQGNSCRGSPHARRGSPLQAGHGTRPQGSPKLTHVSPKTFSPYGARSSPISSQGTGPDAGDGTAGGSVAGVGESNGWAAGRRARGPAITDRLVSLKAEFLELHDMLLESDFQWEQSQKFCEMLKVQLDQLMITPHRNRGALVQPLTR